MQLRGWYLVAAVGFAFTAAASAQGVAPPWPHPATWASIAAIASLALGTYAVRGGVVWLRWSTVSVQVAAAARMIGWVAADVAAERKMASVGTYAIVFSLMAVVHLKARRFQ